MPTEISNQLRSNGTTSTTRASDGTTAKTVPEIRQVLPGKGNSESGKSAASDVSSKQVDQIVEDLKFKVQDIRRELQFSVDKNSGHTVITVLDSETKEVIRQIPPEEVVALAEHFENHAGLLMSARV